MQSADYNVIIDAMIAKIGAPCTALNLLKRKNTKQKKQDEKNVEHFKVEKKNKKTQDKR
jgi:hypothetical protein